MNYSLNANGNLRITQTSYVCTSNTLQ